MSVVADRARDLLPLMMTMRGAKAPIYSKEFGIQPLDDAFIAVENGDYAIAAILMHPETLRGMEQVSRWVEELDSDEGFWGAEVVTDDKADPGLVYILADKAVDDGPEPLEDSQFQVIIFPHKNRKVGLSNRKFKLVEFLIGRNWVRVRQLSTGEERWVYRPSLAVDGVEVAFFDADPTYLPP